MGNQRPIKSSTTYPIPAVISIGLPAFLERYHDIASVDDPLFVAPAEQNILQKLVWPLRHAKGLPAIFGRHLRIWENGRIGPGGRGGDLCSTRV